MESAGNFSTHSHNDTVVPSANSTAAPVSFFSHPVVRAVSADIVAGQIIATVIVIAFVAIFLLREWISQNARPGIFDDADPVPGPDDLPAPAVPVVPPANAQNPPVLRLQEAWEHRPERAVPAPDVHPPEQQHGQPLNQPNGKGPAETPNIHRWRSAKERQVADAESGGSHSNLRRRHSWNGLEEKKLDYEQPTYISQQEFVRQEKEARSSGKSYAHVYLAYN